MFVNYGLYQIPLSRCSLDIISGFLQETEEDLKEIEAYTTAMTVLEDAKVHANR